MSGTSLDGLDIAAVTFRKEGQNWDFELHEAVTVAYPPYWETMLRNSHELDAVKLMALHNEYGTFIGQSVCAFTDKNKFHPDLISSHGHTVFHQPEKRFTFQLGNGFAIAAETGVTTVADFRQPDVLLGGQGAPLVPVGDKLLFGEYDSCLNLGGFANISFDKNGERVAFDICPVNLILNHLASKTGLPFDKDGLIGRKGTVDKSLLSALNKLEYYQLPTPKSLGREWVETCFLPELGKTKISLPDITRTVYEHLSLQLSNCMEPGQQVFITGGGAFNKFLIELIAAKSKAEIVLPTDEIINFKEALIFAFLGVLRLRNEINCLSSVTGAIRDSSSGAVFSPF